ncbi:ubiquitin-specific protease ubp2 [Mortierella antarctica]|nr:ubiquitin-specific protease ubp2 [Mortierella antarctica]
MADYDTRALAGFAEAPVSSDNAETLIRALSLSSKGTTPQRWIVDLAFHEIGLMPHAHVFYLNPNEGTRDDEPMNICCQTCFKQYTIMITPGSPCNGLLHHLHAMFEPEAVAAECCHCGSSIHAILEQPTIPQSLIYRMRKARRPEAKLSPAPHFHDTVEVLIRILSTATKPGSNSINTGSNMFKNKIGLDDASKEFLKFAGFLLIEERFHPPEHSPESVQFLHRCCFQLQLILLTDKPGTLSDKPEPSEKVIPLSDKGSLFTERDAAIGKLGCLTNMGDDAVIDAFRTQVSHDVTAAHPLVDVLVEVQKKRKSDPLDIEIVCQRSEGIVTTAELRSAYRDFEIPECGEGISTEVLIGLIRASLHSGSKENLKIIATSRHDLDMNQLLDVPLEDSPMEEDPILDLYYAQNPVGLSNIGNTCYLNSLLQYFYTVKEIRETVINMEAYMENEDSQDWKEKVIDGRVLSRQDVAEAKEIVIELRKLFLSMQSARSRSVTPSSRLVELLLSTGKDGLTEKGAQRSTDHFFEQQDVSETMSILMYRLNAAFQPIISGKDGKPVERFNSLFYVRANRKSEEIGTKTGHKEERRIPEDFSTLLLNVKEDVTMEELIDEYFDANDEGDDSEELSEIDSKLKDVSRRTRAITVTELPSILQIHLMRTHFDRDDKTSYKSNASVTIPKRLYMDQYMESSLEGNQDRLKQMKLWKGERRKCRRVLEDIKKRHKAQALQEKVDNNAETNIDIVPAGSEAAGADGGLVETQDKEADLHAEQLTKIAELTDRLQNETSDLHQAEYKIHAVFHHEGGANFGHYWVYILDDQPSGSRWLKYSDDIVSEVGLAQEHEVFQGVQGSTACLCVYVQSNAQDVVQTVGRSIAG